MIQSPRWFVACALLAFVLPARASEVDKYLPNDSEIVVSVNVRQLLDAGLVKKHLLTHLQGYLKQNTELKEALAAVACDPLKDVDRVTAAGPNAYAAEKGLIIIRGKFDVAKIRAKAVEVAEEKAAALKIRTVGDYTVYEATGPKGKEKPATPIFLGLLNGKTLVLSHRQEYVVEAFDKETGKKQPALKKGVEKLVEKADNGQTVWVVVPSHTLAKGALGKQEKAEQLLGKCDALTVGVTVADDIDTDVVLVAKTTNDAQSLATELKDGIEQLKPLVGFFVSQKKELAPLVDILDSTKVGAKGLRVSIKNHVDADLIDKALKKE